MVIESHTTVPGSIPVSVERLYPDERHFYIDMAKLTVLYLDPWEHYRRYPMTA